MNIQVHKNEIAFRKMVESVSTSMNNTFKTHQFQYTTASLLHYYKNRTIRK